MSETLRVALVAEGITDYEFLNAAIEAMTGNRPYNLKLLQPDGSVAFDEEGNAGDFGGGWRGVYRWCQQTKNSSLGDVSAHPLFDNFDLLIIHLDADVSKEDPARYKANPILDLAGVLPFHQPCPPAQDTTNRLREVMISWLGCNTTPPKTVLCTPSKNTEAWVVAVFIPDDKIMEAKGWECYIHPEKRLHQLPIEKRFKKSAESYRERKSDIKNRWYEIVVKMTEAKRFHDDFLALIDKI